ncbi:MAG: peptidylprolyl isomerase [Desulfuromonadaceae bacterium]|nr:peptidylprolyl isomerase [Desulfuromonadaceae bacterium]MDD5106334.1 peptidylprolyl isomerase [Desulfuromonadaceae bacterium]
MRGYLIFILLLISPAAAFTAEKAVVATVGGTEISATEFDREILRVRRSSDLKQALKAMDPDRRREILEEYLEKKMLVQGAIQEKLDKDDLVAAEIQDARDNILAEAYVARSLDGQITPVAVREFFDKNPDLFRQPPKIKVRHILLKTAGEAEAVLKRVRNGDDFCRVAEVASIDTATARNCGELGWITPGVMVRSFEEYLNGLKPGDGGGITGTSYGFHVVQVTERAEGSIPRFDATGAVAAEKLKQKLLDDLRRRLRREFPVNIKVIPN